MLKFILVFLYILFNQNALADCMQMPEKITEIKLDKISLPLFDATGKIINGCILHSQEKIVGYTKEVGLCQSKIGEKLKVKLTYGCCDTGPDFGDIECIVRTKSAHGNGVVVHSLTQQ